MIPKILLKSKDNYPQAPQEEPSLSNRYVKGTLSLLPQMDWIPRCLDSKEGRISLQWLECRIGFISQDKGMPESSLQSLEKALSPRFIRTQDLTSLDTCKGGPSSVLQKVKMPDSS